MAINVKFGSDPQPVMQDTSIGVKIDRSPSIGVSINNPFLHEIKFKLNIREAHNGALPQGRGTHDVEHRGGPRRRKYGHGAV